MCQKNSVWDESREELIEWLENGQSMFAHYKPEDKELFGNLPAMARKFGAIAELLKDDQEIIGTYVSVLQDITGNRMSKPYYTVAAVLDCVRKHYCDGCDEKPEPRLMSLEEVIERGKGAVLWVEEAQGVTWNLFPLEIDLISTHPDTDTYYLFFITYHGCKKFEATDYGTVWRCWTSRPTDEQRESAPWE